MLVTCTTKQLGECMKQWKLQVAESTSSSQSSPLGYAGGPASAIYFLLLYLLYMLYLYFFIYYT